MAAESLLKEINVDSIERNQDNPRIVFRPAELAQLMESIGRIGVQVPISVYRKGKKYVLIDGERRWRCSIKLNRKTIPAIIQGQPDDLQNLLLMFNIHALREQWDLLTISMKLPRVIGLLKDRFGRRPNERELAQETGLSQGVIRRCRLLMDLPSEYQEMILIELQKPKSKQRLTEDFFIEMERALKTLSRAMPEVLPAKRLDSVRRTLIRKYQSNVIKNVVHFRLLAKIARAERVGAAGKDAKASIERLFTDSAYSIESAYNASVAFAYFERDLVTRASGLEEYLRDLEWDELDADVRSALRALAQTLAGLVG